MNEATNRQAIEADKRATEMLDELNAQRNGNTETPDGAAPESSNPGEEKNGSIDGVQHQTEHQSSSELEALKNAHKVLQGKFDREVPRLHYELRQLRRENKDKDRTIEELQSKLEQARQQTENQQQTDNLDELLNSVGEEYGPDMVAAFKAMLGKIDSVKPAPAEKPAANTQNAEPENVISVEEAVGHVRELVGGDYEFQRIDNDPLFKEWLAKPEYEGGPTRSQMMNDAFQSQRFAETAEYFLRFRNQQGSAQQDTPNTDDNRQERLDELVAPGGMNASPNAGDNKPTFKESEIAIKQKEFATSPYYRTAKGEAEAVALEKEWLIAQQDGRIIKDR